MKSIWFITGWLFGAALSWLLTCGVLWVIYWCFSWVFSLKVATGIWLIAVILTKAFGRKKK